MKLVSLLQMVDEFPNSLYDSSSPPLVAKIYEKQISNKSILIIQISASNRKPCYLKSKGIPNGVFIRVGANTRKADEASIEELIRENKGLHFDEETIHKTDKKLFDKNKIINLYQRNVENERLILDRLLKDNLATVSGILLLNKKPDNYIPEVLILCTRFAGDKGRNIIQREEITGPIDEQVEKSYLLIKSWLSRNYQLKGSKMTSETLIPEEALREVLINAVVHRKYSITSPIKISVYEKHLEIFSPGSLPDLINLNSLGDGTSYARNPHLVKAFRKLGLVESLGSGIRLIKESCKAANLKDPEFLEDSDYLKVIFYFDKVTPIQETDENKILQYIENHQSATVQDLVQYLELSRNTVSKRLKDLESENKIMRIGQTRATKFIKL